ARRRLDRRGGSRRRRQLSGPRRMGRGLTVARQRRSTGSGRLGAVSLLHRDKGPIGTRYRMREKLFAIGDDYWIETEGGERAFKVNGKALRLRNTFILEGPSGDEL